MGVAPMNIARKLALIQLSEDKTIPKDHRKDARIQATAMQDKETCNASRASNNHTNSQEESSHVSKHYRRLGSVQIDGSGTSRLCAWDRISTEEQYHLTKTVLGWNVDLSDKEEELERVKHMLQEWERGGRGPSVL
jgi:hypothetical protein